MDRLYQNIQAAATTLPGLVEPDSVLEMVTGMRAMLDVVEKRATMQKAENARKNFLKGLCDILSIQGCTIIDINIPFKIDIDGIGEFIFYGNCKRVTSDIGTPNDIEFDFSGNSLHFRQEKGGKYFLIDWEENESGDEDDARY